MKKNVFSRAIAVLASMTVLGAASMLSASAAPGIEIGKVTVVAGSGETSAKVPFYLTDVQSSGVSMYIEADSALTLVKAEGGVYVQEVTDDGLLGGVWGAGEPFSTDEPFTTITVTFDADIEPGEYPIKIQSFTEFDNAGENLEDPVVIEGAVVVEPAATEATTEAPTEAPTAAPTTAAPTTTTPKKGASPKTGSTGVAVAVAGLVTAGATAVVLKKKH